MVKIDVSHTLNYASLAFYTPLEKEYLQGIHKILKEYNASFVDGVTLMAIPDITEVELEATNRYYSFLMDEFGKNLNL